MPKTIDFAQFRRELELSTMKCKRMYRRAAIRADAVDADARTVELSFSSTQPVDRYFGAEILLHGAENVDLSHLNDGGPLLSDHDPTRQIGVVERAWLAGDKGHALLRFSQRDAAEDEFRDVIDGIRKNVSVGYRIEEMSAASKSGEARVTRWTPLEISLVALGADPTVGVGRAADEVNTVSIVNSEDNAMPEATEPKTDDKAAAPVERKPTQAPPVRAESPPVDVKQLLADERARTREIEALGREFDQERLASKAAQEGTPLEQFRMMLIQAIGETRQNQSYIGMTPRETQQYSFLRAIRAQMFPNDRRFQEAAAFEREVSEAAGELHNRDVRGMLVPYDVLRANRRTIALSRAPLTTVDAGAAAELVGTDHLGANFIDILRNSTQVIQLGATELNGLQGNVAIPKQASSAQSGWVDPEGGDGAETTLGTGQITLSPNQLSAWQEYTRKLLLQSDPSIEGLVERDLAANNALELDRAALYGSGASGEPSGIQTLVTQITARFAAAVPTWAEIVAMESAVAAANGDVGSQAYLVEATMRGGLKTTTKDAGSGQFIWSDSGNMVNGYPAAVSNQVVAGDVFFAAWAQLIIAQWGALDIMVNPYSNDKSGNIRVTSHSFYDIGVRHPESFAWNNDTA